MLFNSIDFAVFLPVVFLVYWFVANKNIRLQNAWILVTSYVFYGWWDWRFLSLIIFSSMVDYLVSQQMSGTQNDSRRKALLTCSVAVNLGLLGLFKYYDFFAVSLSEAFTLLGTPLDVSRLNILLPVGISFYTFQTLSYSIDVYRRKIEPSRDFFAFFAYVSFFPQLVAGPIERASNLLPQFDKKRVFNYAQASDGMRQILWGFFKKIVIADNCATYVNQIFDHHLEYSGVILVLGAVLFAFQIYGDFSGYSDIAIGTARIFGFSLMRNFAFPYFSRDIAEFWRRWHISLSTWFKDYLYIPLGGSQGSRWQKVLNTFIVFVVSGMWHGANWTFLFWGFLNACYFLPLLLTERNRKHLDVIRPTRWLPSMKETSQILLTFSMTTLAWIFFRANSLTHAWEYLSRIFASPYISNPGFSSQTVTFGVFMLLIMSLVVVEWLQRDKQHGLQIHSWPLALRHGAYLATIFAILIYGNFSNNEFIYFQF